MLPTRCRRTADPVRQDEHQQDEHGAEDDRRASGLLGLLDDPVREERPEVLPWPTAAGTATKIAPTTSPESLPRPPTTIPTSRKIESATGDVSGLTNALAIANSPPATPAYAALTANASVL